MRMILRKWKLQRAFKRAASQPVSQVQWSDLPPPSDYWANRRPFEADAEVEPYVRTLERWGGAHNR